MPWFCQGDNLNWRQNRSGSSKLLHALPLMHGLDMNAQKEYNLRTWHQKYKHTFSSMGAMEEGGFMVSDASHLDMSSPSVMEFSGEVLGEGRSPAVKEERQWRCSEKYIG